MRRGGKETSEVAGESWKHQKTQNMWSKQEEGHRGQAYSPNMSIHVGKQHIYIPST